MAPSEADIRAFYDSWEWKRMRYRVLQETAARCSCCGSSRSDGARIVVDHIKPIRFNWHRRLDRSNLQVLCDDCNMGKSSYDETDWHTKARRPPSADTKIPAEKQIRQRLVAHLETHGLRIDRSRSLDQVSAFAAMVFDVDDNGDPFSVCRRISTLSADERKARAQNWGVAQKPVKRRADGITYGE